MHLFSFCFVSQLTGYIKNKHPPPLKNSYNSMCCHTDTEVADQPRCLIKSQHADWPAIASITQLQSHDYAFVCWLTVERPSNILVYLRDGSAQTSVHSATLRQKLHIKLSISLSHTHSIPTPGQTVPCWPYNARRLAGQSLEYRSLSHWYDSTLKNSGASGNRTLGLPPSKRTP